jgi:hypothetical protein
MAGLVKPYEPENSSKYFHKRVFSDGVGQIPSAFLLDVVLPFLLVYKMLNWFQVIESINRASSRP